MYRPTIGRSAIYCSSSTCVTPVLRRSVALGTIDPGGGRAVGRLSPSTARQAATPPGFNPAPESPINNKCQAAYLRFRQA